MNWIRRLLRDFIINTVLDEVEVGGHCGCCGNWIPDKLVWASWPWTICDECIKGGREE